MANEEHVKILEQGVKVWNKWRKENRDVRPDLLGADLLGAFLFGVFLNGANLSRANLSGAFLFEANLVGANLSGANLSRAFFLGANLFEANLSGVNLFEAHLGRTILFRADLRGADLRGARFLTKAQIESAITDKNTKLPHYFVDKEQVPDRLPHHDVYQKALERLLLRHQAEAAERQE